MCYCCKCAAKVSFFKGLKDYKDTIGVLLKSRDIYKVYIGCSRMRS